MNSEFILQNYITLYLQITAHNTPGRYINTQV